MELNNDIREDLKCSICKWYLTCTPILVRPNGDSICGRCVPPAEERHLVVRNNAYEKIASAFIFQCRYKDEGCNFKSTITSLEEHENYCLYHKFNCPVLPTGSCTWIDSRSNLKDHFQSCHSELLLTHPSDVKPQILKNSENNFLTEFSNELFLIQTKFNVSSAKFWHNVRLINDPKLTKGFEYNFEILSERYNLVTKCDVIEQEFLQSYDDPQKEIDFNNLCSFIGRFDSLIFRITIHHKEKFVPCDDCKNIFPVKELNGKFCNNCNKIVNLSSCVPSNYKCKNIKDGCLFKSSSSSDIDKHQIWFCEYAKNKCFRCVNSVCSLFSHNISVHNYDINSEIIKKNELNLDTMGSAFLIVNDAIFICQWNLSMSYLEFKIISNLSKTDNIKYECILKLTNPRNNFQKKYILAHSDDANYDWMAFIKPTGDDAVIGVILEKIKSQNIVKNLCSFELKISKK